MADTDHHPEKTDKDQKEAVKHNAPRPSGPPKPSKDFGGKAHKQMAAKARNFRHQGR